MATYVRSDIATAPPVASSLFTLIDTFPPSLQSVVDLNTTFTSLFFSLFPSLLTSGSTTLTDPALVLTDGSKLTLNGSFTVTLTNASLGFPVSTGLISISGSATGLIRKAGVDVIETITGVTVPFSTDPISVSYNALGGITLGTIVTHAPTLDQIISGNDTVTGGIQDDTLYGFAGADTINGNGGNDTIGLITGDTAAGETINGGSGTDKLLIGGTVDLSSVTLTSIEQLDFNNPFTTGANSATFLASELNGTALSTSLGVTGETGAADAIVFNMAAATTLSLAGLTFATWAPAAGDVIQINGDSDAETITGSSQKDVITSAGGNDNVDGGSGDDTIFAGTGSDTVNGGDGNDTLVGNDTSDLFFERGRHARRRQRQRQVPCGEHGHDQRGAPAATAPGNQASTTTR